jgi:hypothetical protein
LVQGQPEKILAKTLSQKRAGGVAQGIGPEFKPQYCKKTKQKKKTTLFKNYAIRRDGSNTAPALQVRSLEFKLQFYQK